MGDNVDVGSVSGSEQNPATPNSTIDLDLVVATVCGFGPANQDHVDTQGKQRFQPENLGLPRCEHHKLDVLRPRQISRLMRINIVVWTFAILYSVIGAVLASTIWQTVLTEQRANGPIFIRYAHIPMWFQCFDGMLRILAFFALLFTTVIFSSRVLFREDRYASEQQFGVVAILWSNMLATFPVVLVWLNGLSEHKLDYTRWLTQNLDTAGNIWTLRLLGSSMWPLAYLWCTSAMYANIDDERPPFFKRKFYIWKLLPLFGYQASGIVAALLRGFRVPIFPLTSIVAYINIAVTIKSFEIIPLVCAVILGVRELILLIVITFQTRKTGVIVRDADRLKYRSKRSGFLFFLYHNLLSYIILILLDIFVTSTAPMPITIAGWLLDPPRRFLVNDNFRAGIEILNCVCWIITAYINLPVNSTGITGWFWGTSRYEVEEEEYGKIVGGCERRPFAVSAREIMNYRKALPIQHRDNIVMETVIQLFNFSWLVGVFENTPEVLDELVFRVKKHLVSNEYGIQVLVTSGVDRIIVSFEGANNIKSIQSGINLSDVSLDSIVPTIDTILSLHTVMDKWIWKTAHVLKGVNDAYSSISRELYEIIEEMLNEKQRTVMCTGHSLGAAIATLAALDLRLSLGIAEEEMVLITFGSPRLFNQSAADVMDIIVPLHWRFRMERDLVPDLPASGYAHSGRCASLAVDGTMRVEQNALEVMVSKKHAKSVSLHKKGVYMLALKAFCKDYFEDFSPQFWDFSIHPEEFTDSVRQLNLPGLEDLVCDDVV